MSPKRFMDLAPAEAITAARRRHVLEIVVRGRRSANHRLRRPFSLRHSSAKRHPRCPSDSTGEPDKASVDRLPEMRTVRKTTDEYCPRSFHVER